MAAEEEEGVEVKRSCLPIVVGVLAALLVIGTACGKEVYDGCPKKADGSLDCSNQDLSGERLRELDFSGADFTRANLKGANLKKADLSGANLSGLDLSEEDMFNGADLSGANLSGANLSGADLRNVNFSGANFKGADLRGADFAGGWRPDAKLTGANLEGVTADTNTDWPGDFDWKAAGVSIINKKKKAEPTTTVKLPKGFNLPSGDVIDRKATLIDSGYYEINIKVRNSGTASAYYCIVMEYKLNDDDLFAKNSHLILRGLGSWLDVTYGTDYAIPPDGQEKLLILEKRRDERGLMFSEYVGRFEYKIRRFEKLSSPAGSGCRS